MKYFIRSVSISVTVMAVIILSYNMFFTNKTRALNDRYTPAVKDISEIYSVFGKEETELAAMYAEAITNDGDYLTKVGICCVIFNRMMSFDYPYDVEETVRGIEAFDTIIINNTDVKPSAESVSAALDAAIGISPCADAIGFYREGYGTDNYGNLEIICKLGGFVFYK